MNKILLLLVLGIVLLGSIVIIDAGYSTHEKDENSKSLYSAYSAVVGQNEISRQERTQIFDDDGGNIRQLGVGSTGTQGFTADGRYGSAAASGSQSFNAGGTAGGCIGSVCPLPPRQQPIPLNTNDIDEPNSHIAGVNTPAYSGTGKTGVPTYPGGYDTNLNSKPSYDELSGNSISPNNGLYPGQYPGTQFPDSFGFVRPNVGNNGGYGPPPTAPTHTPSGSYGSVNPVPSIYPNLHPEQHNRNPPPAHGYPNAAYPPQPQQMPYPQQIYPPYALPPHPYGEIPQNPSYPHGSHPFGHNHRHPHDHSSQGYGGHPHDHSSQGYGGHSHDHSERGYSDHPHHHVDHSLRVNTEYNEDGHHVGPFQPNNGGGYGSGFGGGYNGAYNHPGY